MGQILAFQNLSEPQSPLLENGRIVCRTCVMELNTSEHFKDLEQYLPLWQVHNKL